MPNDRVEYVYSVESSARCTVRQIGKKNVLSSTCLMTKQNNVVISVVFCHADNIARIVLDEWCCFFVIKLRKAPAVFYDITKK